MFKQNELIAKVKQLVELDEQISACMMYGSFTKGEADQYSDIEFYIFLKDDTVSTFDSAKWLYEVAPYSLLYQNEYGTEVVIFENLIRGEFHFLSEREMDIIPSFKKSGYIPDTKAMFIYDETGQLKRYLAELEGPGPNRLTDENVNFLLNNFSNLWLMGINVLKRGEYVRSLELLSLFQKNILQLIRLVEGNADNWFNMTKNLEKEISTENYEKFKRTTARLEESGLYEAYKNSLLFVMELRSLVKNQYHLTVTNEFFEKLLHYMNE